jgi:hypothetical protein
MPREKIGTRNGEDFYVGGTDQPPAEPVLRYTQPPAPPAVPAVPSSPAPALQTLDQFSAARTGTVDENAIREATRKNMQAQIDSTNAYYDTLVRQENQAGEARNDKVRALNVNSGLGGSSFATAADLNQKDKNQGALKAVEAERNVQIQSVMGNIDKVAREEIAAKKAEALGNAEAYSTYLEKARTQAKDTLTGLAKTNADISALDPQRKEFLYRTAGIDPEFGDLYYDSLKPVQEWVTKIENGYIISSRTNPQTGKPEIQTTQLPGMEGMKGDIKFAPDGTAFLVPEKFDPSKPLEEQIKVLGQYGKPEDPKKDIVRINGVDYEVDEAGNYTTPTTPTAPSSEKVTKAKDLVTKIDNLLNNPNLSKAVGPLSSQIPGFLRSGARNDVESEIKQLVASMALENLSLLKGPMSDKDVVFIKEASSGLLTNMSEEGFKAKLQSLKDTFSAIASRAESESGSGATFNPNDPKVQELKAKFPDATDEEIMEALGFSGSATGSNTNGVVKTGMRTDRHNNPTAFTTDIAKMAGLREGVDYKTGDPFSGGKYHTALLLGDPIATTIKVIDNIGLFTNSGKPRWTYISKIPQAAKWSGLSYKQKKSVIAQMYRHEGGNQLTNYFA